MLIVVKPGIVLTSLSTRAPVSRERRKSTRAMPGAVDGLERGDRQPADLVRDRGWQLGRNDRLRTLVEVLRLVVVELARGDDFARHRGLRLVVAEHAALDFPRVGHRGLDDDLAVERPSEIHRLAQTGRVFGLRNAHARPEIGRLDEHREAQPAFELGGDDIALQLPVVPQHDAIVADGQAAGREEHLGQRLVHAERGRGDAGADVGHVGEFEQALNRAVFAVRTVEHRKNDVEVEARHRRFGRLGRRFGGALDRENRLLART